MSNQPPQPNLDTCATLPLTQVRATLDQALATYGADPQLRRAFIQGIGAIDDRLGQPRIVPPNRRMRRQGR
jgi:hypothetical protein